MQVVGAHIDPHGRTSRGTVGQNLKAATFPGDAEVGKYVASMLAALPVMVGG